MNNPELFRADGTVHDLAIERRIAGELSEELSTELDAHLATHPACCARFEQAQQHQQNWTPPTLQRPPTKSALYQGPELPNRAANRPLLPIILPAVGLTAAAAVALFAIRDIDPKSLATSVNQIPQRSMSFEITTRQSANNSSSTMLRTSSPGHAAVIRIAPDGSYSVVLPENGSDSIPIQGALEFTVRNPEESSRLIGIRCDDPFEIGSMMSEVNFTTNKVIGIPSGCLTAE